MTRRVLAGFHIVGWTTDARQGPRRRMPQCREGRYRGERLEESNQRSQMGDAEGRIGPDRRSIRAARMRCKHHRAPLADTQTQRTPARMILRQNMDEPALLLRQWATDRFLSSIQRLMPLSEKIKQHAPTSRTILRGLSNARLEAVNNRIKTTIRMDHGYCNFDNLIRSGHGRMRRPRPSTPRTTIPGKPTSDSHLCKRPKSPKSSTTEEVKDGHAKPKRPIHVDSCSITNSENEERQSKVSDDDIKTGKASQVHRPSRRL